jgi:hypothetical protein
MLGPVGGVLDGRNTADPALKRIGLNIVGRQEGMSQYSSEIAEIFKEADRRSEKYLALLKREGDLPSIVLRGHLVLEELLYRCLQAHCVSPEHLDAARLRFSQLVPLVQALLKLPAAPPSLWQALSNLNALRNELAHNLDPPRLSARVSEFVTCALGSERKATLASPPDSTAAVGIALCFLLGQLEALGLFSESLEYLIVKRISEEPSAPPPAAPHLR